MNALAGRRILVVEDEYLIAFDIARTLQERGAEIVGPAPTVREALVLLMKTERIDGAILDINLRGEMVFPVAEALRRRGVPFVFATGYDETVVPEAFGEVVRCEKPVDPTAATAALFG